METKDVTVKQNNAVANVAAMPAGFSAEDFIIPWINLIQKMSKKNNGKDANYGELRDSSNNKLMGSMDEPFEFIPLTIQKKWVVLEKDSKGKFQKKETIGWDHNRPLVSEDGNVKNVLSYQVYLLDPKEIAEGEDMPYVMAFQSTSSRAGKKLFTQMYMRNQRAGLAPYAATMNLSVSEQVTDDNAYGVMDVSVGRKITKEEEQACQMWLQTIMSGEAKEEDFED